VKLDARVDKDAWRYTAFLDGVPQEGCVMADEEAGVVEVWQRSGEFWRVDDETVFKAGKVEIRAGSLHEFGADAPFLMVRKEDTPCNRST
jgi:hypothetical protein